MYRATLDSTGEVLFDKTAVIAYNQCSYDESGSFAIENIEDLYIYTTPGEIYSNTVSFVRVTSSNSDCKATEVALNVLSASAGSPSLDSIATRTLNEGHTSHTANFIVPADTASATY